MGTELQFCKDEKVLEMGLHNNVTVRNVTELYISKWVR